MLFQYFHFTKTTSRSALADRWIEQIIDVNRVNDRIMLVKLLLGKVTVVIVSGYAPTPNKTCLINKRIDSMKNFY